MDTSVQTKRERAVWLFTSAALLLMVIAYFLPIWWVSLTAPQYPPEAFPQGVRINFHFNGVFNGCELKEKAEIQQEQALDCVHEMDAINHFVGMYPIAAGGVIERFFSPFLISLLGVMLVGFMISRPTLRLIVMGVGFAVIAVWMSVTYFMPGGIRFQNSGYLSALVTSLGQGREEEGEELSPIIAQLKKSLTTSGAETADRETLRKSLREGGYTKLEQAIRQLHEGSGAAAGGKKLKTILEEAKKSGKAGKELSITILREAFEADQARKPPEQRQEWNGSGYQVLFWHYEKSLGRWFNNPEEIKPLVARMKLIGTALFVVVIAGMIFLLLTTRKTGGLFYWALVVIPMLLPIFFIIEYSGWLWWYGHNMNEMGAFSLKPFMPTVFGQGKVAQFTTHSYPSIGFGLLVAMSVLLLLAALIRRKQLQETN